MKRFLAFIFLAVMAFSACTPKRSHSVDFYYWKSKYAIGETEKEYFSQLNSRRLFLRLFDVDIENDIAVPVGRIQSFNKEQLLGEDVEVVPVVFITNRTFQHYDADEEIEKLVANVCSGINHYLQDVEYAEIQIDCDWTAGTRDAYFRFLKSLAEHSGEKISCTLRLHQIRDRRKTGVPPVDKGSLMCYATSSPTEGMTRNSILDIELLKSYTANINDYPLPFDVILPIYSWGIVTNHLGKVKLINGLTEDDLQTPLFEKMDGDRYLVKEDAFLQGMYINKGFTIKIECISNELLSEAKHYLDNQIKRDFGWVYFHLSKGFLTRYAIDELK